MLSVGILAILSLGLLGVGLGGGGDSADLEQDDNNVEAPENETGTNAGGETSNILDEIEPAETGSSDGDDTETPKPIEDTAAPEEAVAPEEVVAQPEEVEETVPPVVLTPEEQAQNLVSVVSSAGEEVDDDLVVEEGPQSGPDADRSYIVTGPENAHSIEVGYDPDTTFAIDFNDSTRSISASLNSNIMGVEGEESEVTTDMVDDEGIAFTETVITKNFSGSTNILMNVDQSQVGPHVAEIDLSNPNDTLSFEFTNMMGNVHLVYGEEEETVDNESRTFRTAYVIETPHYVTSLSNSEIAEIISDSGQQDQDGLTQLLATIDLGEEGLILEGDGSEESPYTQTISSFVNENPRIGTNFNWISVKVYGDDDGSNESSLTPRVEAVEPTDPVATPGTGSGTGMNALDGLSLDNLDLGQLMEFMNELSNDGTSDGGDTGESLSPQELALAQLNNAGISQDEALAALNSSGFSIPSYL